MSWEEVLNAHLLESLNEVRELTYRWLDTYNETRPHEALGQVPPSVFRRELEAAEAAWSLHFWVVNWTGSLRPACVIKRPCYS